MSLGAQRRLHGCLAGALTPPHRTPSTNLLQGSVRSTMASSTSQASVPQVRQMHAKRLQPLREDDVFSRYDNYPSGLVAPHVSIGPSNSLAPLPHPALDLILIVSLPPPSAPRSTAALKPRVIKASLGSILVSLGTKDHLGLVAFEVGLADVCARRCTYALVKRSAEGRLSKFSR